VITFYIQMVKSQLHSGIIMFCKKHFWSLFNAVTQEGEIVTIFLATCLVGRGIQPQGGNSSSVLNHELFLISVQFNNAVFVTKI